MFYIGKIHKDQSLLKYNENNGPVREVSNDGSVQKRKMALYENMDGVFIGVVSSKNGPYLFVNQKKFQFINKVWTARVTEHNGSHTFHLSMPDGAAIVHDYSPPEMDEIDPWMTSRSEDFFFWLAEKQDDSLFIDMWTDD